MLMSRKSLAQQELPGKSTPTNMIQQHSERPARASGSGGLGACARHQGGEPTAVAGGAWRRSHAAPGRGLLESVVSERARSGVLMSRKSLAQQELPGKSAPAKMMQQPGRRQLVRQVQRAKLMQQPRATNARKRELGYGTKGRAYCGDVRSLGAATSGAGERVFGECGESAREAERVDEQAALARQEPVRQVQRANLMQQPWATTTGPSLPATAAPSITGAAAIPHAPPATAAGPPRTSRVAPFTTGVTAFLHAPPTAVAGPLHRATVAPPTAGTSASVETEVAEIANEQGSTAQQQNSSSWNKHKRKRNRPWRSRPTKRPTGPTPTSGRHGARWTSLAPSRHSVRIPTDRTKWRGNGHALQRVAHADRDVGKVFTSPPGQTDPSLCHNYSKRVSISDIVAALEDENKQQGKAMEPARSDTIGNTEAAKAEVTGEQESDFQNNVSPESLPSQKNQKATASLSKEDEKKGPTHTAASNTNTGAEAEAVGSACDCAADMLDRDKLMGSTDNSVINSFRAEHVIDGKAAVLSDKIRKQDELVGPVKSNVCANTEAGMADGAGGHDAVLADERKEQSTEGKPAGIGILGKAEMEAPQVVGEQEDTSQKNVFSESPSIQKESTCECRRSARLAGDSQLTGSMKELIGYKEMDREKRRVLTRARGDATMQDKFTKPRNRGTHTGKEATEVHIVYKKKVQKKGRGLARARGNTPTHDELTKPVKKFTYPHREVAEMNVGTVYTYTETQGKAHDTLLW